MGNQQSVCDSAIKYSASLLPISGICSGACWECVGREYQEILAKDTGQQKHEKMETNTDGDVVEAGNKTGRDRAITKRRVGAPDARKQQPSGERGGKGGRFVPQDATETGPHWK